MATKTPQQSDGLTEEERRILAPASSKEALSPEERELLEGAVPISPSSQPSSISSPALSQEEFDILGADATPSTQAPSTAREAALEDRGEIGNEEVSRIAAQTGASPEDIKEMAPIYGLYPEGEEHEKLKRGLGFADRALTLGLGSWTYKKMQDEPTRKAFDQLAELAERRRSGLETAAEVGVGLTAGLLTGTGVARGISSAGKALEMGEKGVKALQSAYTLGSLFGSGAAVGVATSKEGEEEESALIGGAAGLALGGLIHGATKLVSKAGGIVEKALTPDVTEELEKKLVQEAPRLKVQEDTFLKALDSGSVPKNVKADPEAYNSILQDSALREEAVERLRLTKAVQKMPKEDADRLIASRLATAEARSDLVKFASYVSEKEASSIKTPSEALAHLREKAQQETPDFLAKEFRRYQASKAAFDVMGEKLSQQLPRAASFINKAKRWLLDGREVASQIDNRIGTRLERWMDTASKSNNGLTIELSHQMKAATPVLKQIKQAGLRSMPVGALSELEKTGNVKMFEPAQQEAFHSFFRLMEDWRKRANALGVPIERINPEKVKVYIPRAAVDTPEAIDRIKVAAEKVGLDPRGVVSPEQFERLEAQGGTPYRELKKGLSWMVGNEKLDTPEALSLAMKEAITPGEAISRMESKATAVQARAEEGVPDLLRETDLNKLASKWMYNTFRHAYYKEPLAELKLQEKLAIAAKDFDAADYVHKLRQDLAGGRQGTLKRHVNEARTKLIAGAKEMARKAEESGHPAIAKAANFIAEHPTFMNTLMNQVYPNFLGLSPRAMLQNMTQTFYMTAPELGTKYGYGSVLQAQVKAAYELSRGGLGEANRGLAKLRGIGHLPEQQYNRLMDHLAGSVKASEAYHMSSAALNKVTDMSMILFEASEHFNRLTTAHLAEKVAGDLFKEGGSKGAFDWVNRLNRGYRAEVKKAIAAGDKEKTTELITDYLIGKTIFNYNQISMGEYGRFLGPLFSTFSKWPASIAGDIVTQLTKQDKWGGSMAIGRKYLIPLGTAYYLQQLLQVNPQENPREKYLLGAQGFTTAAPIRSIGGFAEGDFFQPPVIKSLQDAAKGILKADPYEAWRVLNQAAEAFMPGAFILRILGKDMQKMRNEKGSGTLFNELMETLRPGTDLDARVRDAIGRSD